MISSQPQNKVYAKKTTTKDEVSFDAASVPDFHNGSLGTGPLREGKSKQ
jgi:hypothetical protein